MATDFTVNKADLEFILRQIRIAEATSKAYNPTSAISTVQAIQNEYGIDAANATMAPFGLRTVDGTDNSLVAGQSDFGAADTLFPRLTDPEYRNELDEVAFNGVTNTDYGLVTPGPDNVVDSDPRIISNLIVDMTAGNPAAVAAALKYSVFTGAITEDEVAAAAAAISAAYALTKSTDIAAAAAAMPGVLTGLQATFAQEIIDQAAAQAAYDAAVLADSGNATAAALAAVLSAAVADAKTKLDALYASIIVDTDTPFDGILNVNVLDDINLAAAVAAATVARAAATDLVTYLDPLHAEYADAQAVEASAIALDDAMQALDLALADSDVSPTDGADLVAAQAAANGNVLPAASLASDLNAMVGLGDVATTLAALNIANAELAAAQTAFVNADGADEAATAADEALAATLTSYGVEYDSAEGSFVGGLVGSLVIPNLSPDIGLSPGFNAWMTFFGQFFDHGLDLVTKGANGTVYVPLQPDDPLIAGVDGAFGTADDLARTSAVHGADSRDAHYG